MSNFYIGLLLELKLYLYLMQLGMKDED